MHPFRFRWPISIVLLLLPLLAGAAQKEGDGGWVEEELNPRTEWVERVMTPFNRWVEKSIQGQHQDASSPVPSDFTAGQPPANAISPQEAARLAVLLNPGKVLLVRYLPTPSPIYAVRLLSRQGNITTFYLNALDGTLMDVPEGAASEDETP